MSFLLGGLHFFGLHILVREDVVDHVVLGEGDEVGGYPVDEESSGEPGEEDAKDCGAESA